ncbi:MAG TPA: hypothetical protein VFA65_15025 [Bryobacteraceae bacterium]|nr:hypothetical protein [Bryobacteraceae bacterium]
MHRFFAVPILLSFTAAAGLAASDSGLLALVPADSKIVTSVDVQQARSSQFGQFLLNRMNSNSSEFDKMAQETGFDPRRDLQSFVFASSGPPQAAGQPSFVLIARGTFDGQWLRKQILSQGGSVQNIGGVDVYVTRQHRQSNAFALPDTGIAVLGSLASVQQVIANRANPSVLDAGLQSLIAKVSPNNDAWFASILPGSFLTQRVNVAMNQQAKAQVQAFQSVQQAAGGVQFGDPVRLTLDAVARSPQDAVSLTDVVRFMASMVQMQRQNGVPASVVASALDTMTLNASGNDFHMNVAIPEKNLEQLAASGMNPGVHHGFKAAKPSQQ